MLDERLEKGHHNLALEFILVGCACDKEKGQIEGTISVAGRPVRHAAASGKRVR